MQNETNIPTPEQPPEVDSADTPPLHCGIVAVVGRTNAGKSTLVNRIVGEKISIVTPVVQTTRNNVRGVLTESRGQLTLLDTPGLHKSQSTLCTMMNRMARAATAGTDTVLLVLDGSRRPQMEDDGWMRRLARIDAPCIFLLNKEDAARDPQAFHDLWETVQEETGCRRDDIVWLSASAETGTGVETLVDTLFELLPEGPLLFDAETLTDFPRKIAIADSIREKYFMLLKDELPHAIGVHVETIHEQDTRWDVDATLYVHRSSQKAIVIGSRGRMLRTVKRQAEPELTEMFGLQVKLNLWVKVEKNWDENHFLLKKMGYVQ